MNLKNLCLLSVSFFTLIHSNILAVETKKTPIPHEILGAIRHHVSTNRWSNLYYDVLPKVIAERNIKTVVEIGVGLGGHAESLLKNTAIEHYYGVDPYAIVNANDGFGADIANYSKVPSQKNFDYLFQWIDEYRLAPYKGRYNLIRQTSEVGSYLFENESLECIFVDGDHTYAAVLNDLAHWYPKLKKGGIILGDDYWMSDVSKAVEEFFLSINKPVDKIHSKSNYVIWSVVK